MTSEQRPRSAALLAAFLVSTIKVNGFLEAPWLKVDGVKALDYLIERGLISVSKEEAVESAVENILKVAARRAGVEWMSDSDEETVRTLLGYAYENLYMGRPELFDD